MSVCDNDQVYAIERKNSGFVFISLAESIKMPKVHHIFNYNLKTDELVRVERTSLPKTCFVQWVDRDL